jgi:hypothetical protein
MRFTFHARIDVYYFQFGAFIETEEGEMLWGSYWPVYVGHIPAGQSSQHTIQGVVRPAITVRARCGIGPYSYGLAP